MTGMMTGMMRLRHPALRQAAQRERRPRRVVFHSFRDGLAFDDWDASSGDEKSGNGVDDWDVTPRRARSTKSPVKSSKP